MNEPFHSNYANDDPYRLLDFCERIWRRRGRILLWGVAVAMLTAGYSFFYTKPYTAETLLRIDSTNDNVAAVVSSRVLDVSIDSEIDFIRSRSMFMLALNALGPSVDVYSGQSKLKTSIGAEGETSFSSTQPELKIDRLQVPDRLLNQRLTLRIEKDQHYSLYDVENHLLYSDIPTEEKHSATDFEPAIPVRLTVSDIHAPPGSSFTLIPRSPRNYLEELQRQLGAETLGRHDRSGFIRLTFSSENPSFAKGFLSALVDTYIKRAYDVSTSGKLHTIERLDQQQTVVKKNLEDAELNLKNFEMQSGTVDLPSEVRLKLQELMEIETQIRTLNDQLQYLDAEHDRRQTAMDLLPETERQLLQLKREVETYKQMYDLTAVKLTQLHNDTASLTSYAKVIDEPELVKDSGTLHLIKTAILGFVAGCLIGATIVYATVLSPLAGLQAKDQIDSITQLPVLGSLSRSSSVRNLLRGGRLKSGVPFLANGDLSRAPEMVTLMKNLGFASFGAANPVWLITSEHATTGSAVIAANIAAAYAKTNRTLLIDCSMKESGIHNHFRISQDPGLSDMLTGKASIEEAIHNINANLAFLPCGTATSYGTPLLQRTFFVEVLKEFAKSFRHVVLYYPGLAESQIHGELLSYVGSVALVVSAGERVERVRHYFEPLQHLANLKGVILDHLE